MSLSQRTRMGNYCFLLAALFLFGACEKNGSREESGSVPRGIVRGAAVPAGVFPSVGPLLFPLGKNAPELKGFYSPYCTATLIAPDRILTAAHCVSGSALDEINFSLELPKPERFGSEYIYIVGGSRKINPAVRVDVHPYYNPFDPLSNYDYAIVQLRTPITNIAPAKLADSSVSLRSFSRISMVGYGKDELEVLGLKKFADLSPENITEPGAGYYGVEGGQSFGCSGDSGGPLLATNNDVTYTFGVLSSARFRTSGSCASVDRNLYSQVIAQFSWIARTAGLIVESTSSRWTNSVSRWDVNGDGVITPLDALNVINALSFAGKQSISVDNAVTPKYYYDVNQDNKVTPTDAIQIINKIAKEKSNAIVVNTNVKAISLFVVPNDSLYNNKILEQALASYLATLRNRYRFATYLKNYENRYGQSEKWIRSSNGVYFFLTPSGKLFQFSSLQNLPNKKVGLLGKFITSLPVSVYHRPELFL